jgi:hypothetical protein
MLVILFLTLLFPQGRPGVSPTYALVCTHAGASVPCDIADCAGCPMLCQRADNSGPLPGDCSADVDHVEVRDATGHSQCHLDAPTGKLFGWVNRAVINDKLLSLHLATRQEPSAAIVFACEITASELIPFKPAVTCAGCESASLGTYGPLFIFENGYFGSEVALKYDYDQHRIVMNGAVEAIPIPIGPGRYGLPELQTGTSSSTVKTASALDLYSEHASTAAHASVTISERDVVQMLGTWAPISMEPLEGAGSNFEIVRYDRNQEWLQINVNGRTGWIHGAHSFSAIGLPLASSSQ